jgi:hypothetical protein
MHVKIDGKRVGEFPKPTRRQPALVTPSLVFDGVEIAVYAESRDNGNSVEADVFAGGWSLSTGEPLAAVQGRGFVASAVSAEHSRIAWLTMSAGLVWVTPVVTARQALALPGEYANGSAGMVVLLGLTVGIAAISSLVLWLASRSTTITRDQGRVLAAVMLVGTFVASMVSIDVALLVARA